MLCAYVAPEMLIDVKIEPGSKAEEAYRRMDSAVLKNPAYYTTTTSFSFSEEVVEFYSELVTDQLDFP